MTEFLMSIHNPQKVILITGTSSGFGLLTASRLASSGHIVWATMRNLNKSSALETELKRRGAFATIRLIDVTKPETITAVINELIQTHGRLDVVINNAGYGLGGFFEDLTEEEIRQQIDVNLFGTQHIIRLILPIMRQQRNGCIINMSSIAGQTASPCFGAYNASKWALEGFSESLYHELSQFGIHVVLVEPGSYRTKIFEENARYGKNFNNPFSPYHELSQRLKDMVLKYIQNLKKDPEDVARLIERIINTPNPKLRYISDWSSWVHVQARKLIPAKIYHRIYQRILYGK